MASRKTYFGIGLPKDPIDPESGPVKTGGAEAEDRSSPTVVDDEKVAEGLKQLRTWYQGEGGQDGAPGDAALAPAAAPPKEAIPLGGLQARPTAVGHATAPPAAAAPRPVAPDPMRATMYGHDVHKFELEIAMAAAAVAQSAPPEPAPTTTAMVLAAQAIDAGSSQELAPIEPANRSPSGQFPLAPQGEAQRLQRPGGVRRTPYSPPKTSARVPLTSRIMFGAGALALAGAIVIWLQTDGGSDSTPVVRPPTSTPAPVSPPPTAALPRDPVTPPTTRPAAVTDSTGATPGVLRAPTTAPPRAPAAAVPRAERRPAAIVTTRRAPAKVAGPTADGDETTAEARTPAAQEPEREATAQESIPLVPEHPRKKVEAAPEAPPRKRTDQGARNGEPQRGKVRIGADGDETLPPSED